MKCHKPVTGYQRFVSDTAVLVIDMFNTYRHEDAEKLTPSVAKHRRSVGRAHRNRARTRRRRPDLRQRQLRRFHRQSRRPRAAGAGRRATRSGRADRSRGGALFLEKVRHSAFYATSLAYLLRQLETKRLILTGQVTEQCILYTALDAYVRHFPVTVPPDAVAHIDADLGKAALRMMEENMRAEIVPAEKCLG